NRRPPETDIQYEHRVYWDRVNMRMIVYLASFAFTAGYKVPANVQALRTDDIALRVPVAADGDAVSLDLVKSFRRFFLMFLWRERERQLQSHIGK
ncbi:hypothetical protein HK104_005997, partial [Borealophlyctis nickersoniae]